MPLPIAPTDDARRRLLLAKALYQAALATATAPLRSHRRIIAVVNLDLATETLLKAVVWDLGDGRQPKHEFTPLLAQARAAVSRATGGSGGDPPPLPGEAGAWEVHDVRNGAQHRGRAPSEEEVAACRTHTRDALVGVMRLVWDVEFDTLAHSDAIQEPSLRERVAEAEASLQAGAYLDAARSAHSALIRAGWMAMEEYRYGPWSHYQFSGHDGPHPLANFSRDVEREFREVWGAVRRLTLGAEPVSARKLEALTGYERFTTGGEDWTDPQEPIDQAGAEWAVAYCTEQIVQLEERLGPLRSER